MAKVQVYKASSYVRGPVLGEGTYGTVYRCKVAGTLMVAKEPKLWTPDDGGSVDSMVDAVRNELIEECKLLMSLSHRNFVQTYGLVRTNEGPGLALLLEPMDMTLSSLRFDIKRRFPKVVLVRVLKDVTLGVHYLHCKGIVHRDLKTDNVMLTESRTEGLVVKISDVGLSAYIADTGCAVGCCGTPIYAAIEVLALHEEVRAKCDVPIGFPSDIYSLAFLIVEVLLGRKYEIASTVAGLKKFHFDKNMGDAGKDFNQEMIR